MPTSSNILCGCGRFMRVKKNSVTVEELTEDGQPYKLWSADLFGNYILDSLDVWV